jgi:hypothetical protein
LTTFAKSMRPHNSDEAETWREQDLAPTLNGHDMRYQGEATPWVLIEEPMGLRKQSSAAGGPVMLDGAVPPLDTDSGNLAILTSSTADSRVRTSAWPANGPVYPAAAAVSGMNSTGSCPNCGHDGSALRMFPDCFPADPLQAPTSVSCSGGWSTSGTAWPGGFWTRAGSESPSAAVASSLSDVLETRAVPPRYWLSARAAAGILRRAAKRGKTLPTRLQQALEGLVTGTATRGTPRTFHKKSAK